MLLMFAVGTGNVGWMLGLAAIMAIEKNLSWGRRLSTPQGVGLLVWGVSIAAVNTGAFDRLVATAVGASADGRTARPTF